MKPHPTMTPEQEANWVENQRQVAEQLEQRRQVRTAVLASLTEASLIYRGVPHGTYAAIARDLVVSVERVRNLADREGTGCSLARQSTAPSIPTTEDVCVNRAVKRSMTIG